MSQTPVIEPPAAAPIALSYAAPTRQEGWAKFLGVLGIVVGMLFAPVTCYLILKSFCLPGFYFDIQSSNYLSAYGLETLGFGLLLLGNLTIIRAGAMLIAGRTKAALAHRVYVNLMTYGSLAVLIAQFLMVLPGIPGADFRYIMFLMPIFTPLMGGPIIVMLIYPAIVARLSIFKKPKPEK